MTFRIEELQFRYRDDGSDHALNGITAEIETGRTTAIIGLSGSGKSTLLSLLGLLLGDGKRRTPRINGAIEYTDRQGRKHDHLALPGHERERLRLREFGFVLQSAFLMPHFSAERNVTMPLSLLGMSEREKADRLDRTLAALGAASGPLRGLLSRAASTCSGGEKQRLAVLRAVIHRPSVLFADEPTSNLDVLNQEAVLELLQAWKQDSTDGKGDHTLVLVTHAIGHAVDGADRILALHGGRLVGDRTWTPEALGSCRESRFKALETMVRTGVPPHVV